jgi:hypothetical protein
VEPRSDRLPQFQHLPQPSGIPSVIIAEAEYSAESAVRGEAPGRSVSGSGQIHAAAFAAPRPALAMRFSLGKTQKSSAPVLLPYHPEKP